MNVPLLFQATLKILGKKKKKLFYSVVFSDPAVLVAQDYAVYSAPSR